MNDQTEGILGSWDATDEEILKGMGHGIAKVLQEHKDAGRSVVWWDHLANCVLHVPAIEIVVPDDAAIELSAQANFKDFSN